MVSWCTVSPVMIRSRAATTCEASLDYRSLSRRRRGRLMAAPAVLAHGCQVCLSARRRHALSTGAADCHQAVFPIPLGWRKMDRRQAEGAESALHVATADRSFTDHADLYRRRREGLRRSRQDWLCGDVQF